MPLFSKKAPTSKEDFTENYGTVNMISFLCAIWSRLAYMNDHQYLGHYQRIFGPIIPDELMKMINAQITKNGIKGILNDTQMFELNGLPQPQKWDLKTFTSKAEFGGTGLQFLPWAQRVNQVNGEERLIPTESNCDVEVRLTNPDSNLVFVSIATSNYGEVYVTGDKRMPNLVVITFRGTYSAKSAGAYSKPSSLTPIWSASLYELAKELNGKNHETFIFGIYKILMEISHVLMDSIDYVAKQLNPTGGPGTTQLLTTGHSLGNALSTIFAYVYVVHISSLPKHKDLYPQLNENIACIGLGGPRVFGADLANIFCCLTTTPQGEKEDSELCNKILNGLKEHQRRVGADQNDVVGRITYLRITSYNDPVPALPSSKVSNFVHPCSDTIETGILRRKDTNEDCLVQISNSFSSRCRGIRLAMTYDYKLPLNCVDSKEDRANSKSKSPILFPNLMGYHTQYLGISFIGGLSLTQLIGFEIGRVEKPVERGNTVCRLIFYPAINDDIKTASVAFYDLVPKRSHGLGLDDKELEKAEESEPNAVTLGDISEGDKPKPKVTPTSSSSNTTLALLKNLSLKETKVQVPEDYLDTEGVFKELLASSKTYDILQKSPPLKYEEFGELVDFPNQGKDSSFEEGDIKTQSNIISQGGKSKKHKKVAKRKTRKAKRVNTKKKYSPKKNRKTKRT